MKTLPVTNLDLQLRRVEADVLAQIGVLFGICPDLEGFAVQDHGRLPDHIDPSGHEGELFVTDVGCCPAVGEAEYDEICDLIGEAIDLLVSERPEAYEVLRGRTFARTLH